MKPAEEKIHIGLRVPVFVSASGISKKSFITEHFKILMFDIEQFHYRLIIIHPIFKRIFTGFSLFFEN